MTWFGWDASDYDWDRGPMDLVAARAAGIEFFTHKATEGSPQTGTAFYHQHYGEALRRARDAGIPVLGAYHVVRSPADAAAEVDFHLAYVDQETPWWRDWPGWCWQVDLERWPYDPVPASEGETFADIIQDRTGRPALIYASRGQYGDQLAGTSHRTWNANYGANNAAGFSELYEQRGGDDGPGWQAYSGQIPSVWQFGSRAVIGRQSTCDANAIRDPEVWAALMGDTVALTDQDRYDIISGVCYGSTHEGFVGLTAPGVYRPAGAYSLRVLSDKLDALLRGQGATQADLDELQARPAPGFTAEQVTEIAHQLAAEADPAVIKQALVDVLGTVGLTVHPE